MAFYQPESRNIAFLVQRCYFEADHTRVALALDRLSELGKQFPDDARIFYAEGILRQDHLGEGLHARGLFEKAYWAGLKSALQGDYCWSAASNVADLACDEQDFKKWVDLTRTAPPLGQGTRPDFESINQKIAEGVPFREIQLHRASARYEEGHIGPSAALMEVALVRGGHDAMEEAHVRRYRAQHIRELDEKCDSLRGQTFEWFAPDERLGLAGALAEVDRALILDPFDAELWNLSAAWNNLLEKFSQALSAAEKAAELRVPYPKAHINAARALYRMARYEEASQRIALAYKQARNLSDPGDIAQTERLVRTYSSPPSPMKPEDLEEPLETLLRAGKRCSDLEMESVDGDVQMGNLVDRLIDHAGAVSGPMARRYVPLIAELLSDFTPETVCSAIINGKRRSPRLMDDWYYAALFIAANSSGVERRDAARLVWLLLFMPLDANRVRDNYRHLILAPSSAEPLLALDAAMREELRRINPSLFDFVTSQTPLTETDKGRAASEAISRFGAPRSRELPQPQRPNLSKSESFLSSGYRLRSLVALLVGFAISSIFSTIVVVVVAYLTFPLLSDETPSLLGAKLTLLLCSVFTDALAGLAVAKIVRRGAFAHSIALGVVVVLWTLYVSPPTNLWRLLETALTIPAMLVGASLGKRNGPNNQESKRKVVHAGHEDGGRENMGLFDKDDVPRIGRLTRAPVCNSCGGPTRDFKADGTPLLECTKCGKLRTIPGAAYRTEALLRLAEKFPKFDPFG